MFDGRSYEAVGLVVVAGIDGVIGFHGTCMVGMGFGISLGLGTVANAGLGMKLEVGIDPEFARWMHMFNLVHECAGWFVLW